MFETSYGLGATDTSMPLLDRVASLRAPEPTTRSWELSFKPNLPTKHNNTMQVSCRAMTHCWHLVAQRARPVSHAAPGNDAACTHMWPRQVKYLASQSTGPVGGRGARYSLKTTGSNVSEAHRFDCSPPASAAASTRAP